MSGKYRHIICILDREGRQMSSHSLRTKVKDAIVNKLLETMRYTKTELNEKVYVFVPDIMFENWIIADVQGIKSKKELTNQNAKQENYDGKSGSTVLKRMMKTNYHKTQHAPFLLKAVNLKRASTN